ncbi:Prophage CP4-57 integrase [compost metagenome]
MGFADRLTGHGVRATISTALNEIGYPKIWIDAQLSHADPDKVSSAYNHAEYVEQRRTMMQDWANRLDLWMQGHAKAASSPLTIRLEGASQLSLGLQSLPLTPVRNVMKPEMNLVVVEGSKVLADRFDTSEASGVRLVSDIQRERAEMLEIYEAATNLPLLSFARLAGKSRDQINRDIKARRLLSLSLGNRGQRIPDWQLDPLKHKLVLAIFKSLPQLEAWGVYRLLSEPHDRLSGRTPLDVVQPGNFESTLSSLIRGRRSA